MQHMKKTKKKSNVVVTVILVVILIVGVGLLAYPSLANWWNNMHQSRAIVSYVEAVANLDKEDYDRMLQEAQDYNRSLLKKPNRFTLTEEETEEYNKILDVTGTGIMGYIDIPSIKVSLPIYHGTEEAVLQVAIGHIKGTSLPVGGLGTHCAVSGHRGLPSARLFTDIDQLKKGDTFLVQVLDRTLTYEIDQIKTVLPTELDDLEIDPEKDECTLITCTPYGVNTHRLLVRGHRVENLAENAHVTADAMKLAPIFVAPLAAAPILLLMLIILLVDSGRNGKKQKAKQNDGSKPNERPEENEDANGKV